MYEHSPVIPGWGFMESSENSCNLAVFKVQDGFFSLTQRGLLEDRQTAAHERKCWCVLHSTFPLIHRFIKRFSRKSAPSQAFNYTSCVPGQTALCFFVFFLTIIPVCAVKPRASAPRTTWNNRSLSSAPFPASHCAVFPEKWGLNRMSKLQQASGAQL